MDDPQIAKPKQTREKGRTMPMKNITMPPEYWTKLEIIQRLTAMGANNRSATIRYLIDKEYAVILDEYDDVPAYKPGDLIA